MRTAAVFLASLGLLTSVPEASAQAGDDPASARGTVESTAARWSGDRIVTDVIVRTDDGRAVTVTQPGGTVAGVGMVVIPSPPRVAPGDRAILELGARPRIVDVIPAAPPTGLSRPDSLPFVRTVTGETGVPLYWSSGCAFITFDEDGTSHISGDQEFEVMRQVFAHWEDETASCSYFRVVIEDRADVEVGFDRENVALFREDRWCRPETDDDPEECYDNAAAGLTTLFFIDDASSDRNGEILDADIELNAVNFAFSVNGETQGTQGCLADLANTFTHEVGHFLGLDHTCWTGVGARPVDDQGNPVPSCSAQQLPAEIEDATMYNFQECGETHKATLEPDDIAGVCAIYPLADDPNECEPVAETGGCCSAGPRPGPSSLALALLCLGLTARRRARARTRPARGARSRSAV